MDAGSLLAAIVECSSDAIVGKSLDSTVLSWNAAAERIFGYTAEEMIGQSIRCLIPCDRQAEEDRILAAISAGERIPTFDTVRRHKDGSDVHVAVTVSPVYDQAGHVVAASKIARDITESRRVKQALADSENRFRLMADNITQLAWIAGPDGALTWYNRRWYDYTGTDFEQMQGWGWQAVHHPDHVEAVTAKFRGCVESGTEWEDTFPLRGSDGRYRWFLSRAVPMRGATGQIYCWFGTNTDITEQREAEKRIELLMLEVNHRSKNMLAMIQSLARRSANNAAGQGDFVARLERRIGGLAANQDLLVRRAWSNIPVAELIEVQLGFLGESIAQVTRTGEALAVTPTAAETIGMTLHELATNALKYGALSVPEGRVGIAWGRDADGAVLMSWTESGGPPVTEPVVHGFGSRLITDVPRGKLRARVETSYPPGGFRWEMACPAAGVLA
ncbi:PAS domain S-box protein [Novosphingobium flavum]|uniref:histidine kinase n=1 Tax=Novosphingobium flavum TaxID=1778672 RepID=A0A7X1FRC4_9SPHN|nr:PAS domain S-box protein [Novosphingobium flavum]MBC2665551.1 PAS domain S-box protein [Novosphingobium flavum]